MITVFEFLRRVNSEWIQWPTRRRGQIMFNILFHLDEDVAAAICGTEFDPFYDDAVIPKFLEELIGYGIIR